MSVTQYCTVPNVESRISDLGVALRLDDKPEAWDDVLDRAAVKINQYCEPRYTRANLAASDWVRETAITLAVYYLCGRRLNPVPQTAVTDFQEAMDDLKMIRKGQLNINDAPERKAGVPVLSAPRMEMHPTPRTVITRKKSTGTPEGYSQQRDPFEVLDYIIALWPLLIAGLCASFVA